MAGRKVELRDLDKLTERLRLGYVESPRLFEGVRGVGKTVLLLAMRDRVRGAGGLAVHVQARHHEGVVASLLSGIDAELGRIKPLTSAVGKLRKILMSVTVGPPGAAVTVSRPDGSNAVGPVDLLRQTFAALAELPVSVLLTIDELQEMPEPELSALLVALQRSAGDNVPLGVVAAGLPGTVSTAARVESFAERMFTVWPLGPLDHVAATRAVTEPAADLDVVWTEEAVEHVVTEAAGYPYFLQHFGSSTWDTTSGMPIAIADAVRGVGLSEVALSRSLVAARLDRISQRELAYVHALAGLGAGPHRSGDVAAEMETTSDKLGSARQRLIAAGLIYSPGFGQVDFTVPLFHRLLERSLRSP